MAGETQSLTEVLIVIERRRSMERLFYALCTALKQNMPSTS